MANKKRILTPAQKDEQKRIKAAKERIRAQLAFSTIFSTMPDIEREEVNHTTIDLWRSRLNMLRKRGETIKRKDFLACSEPVDPFNADAPAQKALAEWFVEQLRRFKPYATTVHVRGLHYAISALADTPDAVRLPNGVVYDNTDDRWNDLERAGKYARYLGLISPDVWEDRRSRQPYVVDFARGSQSLTIYDREPNLSYYCDLEELPDFPDFPDFPEFPTFPSYSLSLKAQQRYRLEVWIEKSTQDDVIKPVCSRYGVTLFVAQGEISISAMWDALNRARMYPTAETVILYISDFDPAGQSMPVAAARKLEYLRVLKRSHAKVRLYPIALTQEQCVQYKLPRTPLKDTDFRRAGFEHRYGEGATELDALESLHPGELSKIVERAILRFRDATIQRRMSERWSEIWHELEDIEDEIHASYNVDSLEEEYSEAEKALAAIKESHDLYMGSYEEFVEQYNHEVRSKFDLWKSLYLDPLSEKLDSIMSKVGDEMEDAMPDIDEYDLPEAEEVPLADDCLYDSSRDYIPQLAAYKQFAGKYADPEDDDDIDAEAS